MAKIVFKINGKQYEADGKFSPDVSLNEYIRTVAGLRGTKAMCHEGGCGVCIVAVRAALPPTNEVKLFSVNSCLVSVLSCHGWEVITVEGIGSRMTSYHDIQSRLAKFNGTQCGYCTPGWVMNMYSIYEAKKNNLTMKEVENSFAGNICRCTGYRPIADAFKTFANDVDEDLLNKLIDLEDLADSKCCREKCSKTCKNKNKNDGRLLETSECGKARNEKTEEDWCVIEKSSNKMIVVDCGVIKWFKTYSLADVFKVISTSNDYKLIAGNTGQGVYHVTDYPPTLIDIFNVVELKGHSIDVNLIVGAGMPLSEMMELFLKKSKTNEDFSYLKILYDHMDLVAHIPVRNIGTIGGNLYLKYYNNEFQSDLFLLFETVGAMITIAEGVSAMKVVSLTDFLKTDMKRKLIVNVMLPPLSSNSKLKTYKIMPRSQNAHAVVNAGFLFKFKNNSKLLEEATIVYGSISPKFVHATKTEATLAGKDPFTNETLQLALKSLSNEILPEEAPPEPSAAFRKMLAISLYYKAILSLCPDDKINPKFKSGGEAIKRHTSHGTQIFDTDKSVWPLNQPIPKVEGLVQCSGEAVFANDLPTQPNEVFAAFVTADVRPGSVIEDFDTTEAFKISGVIAFYTAKDIPGLNSFTATSCHLVQVNEEILCSSQTKFYGDPVAIIVADREKTANKAAKLVKIKYKSISNNKPLITIEDVLKSPEKDKRVTKDRTVEPKDVGKDVKHVIKGEYKLESQYHFYMEPQTCVVRPTEDGLEVISATQWLDLTNVAIAQCLNKPTNSIQVVVRRVGGAYGGKITRSCQIACAAALVTHHLGRTCRFVLPLETNMRIVGKRLPTISNFESYGYCYIFQKRKAKRLIDDETLASKLHNLAHRRNVACLSVFYRLYFGECAHELHDLIPSSPFHYRTTRRTARYHPHLVDIPSCRIKRFSSTFIARTAKVGVNDEGEIQYLKNTFYQDNGCSPNETISPITVTHFFNCYDSRRWFVEANSVATDTPSNTWCRAPSSSEGLAMIENIMERIAHTTGKDSLHVKSVNMAKEDNPIPDLIDHLKKDSNYNERLEEIKQFNSNNRWRKRALKLMPMTYELFYIGPYNSLISIYHGDGSVMITHGGIEMGQGINTKVAQVCGYMFGIPLEKISVKPSTSYTSPNAMATGASVGSECVAFATVKACEILLERLAPIREMMGKPSWEDLVQKCYTVGVDLQASYMYSSKDDGEVKPYDVFGVCALEVEVDILTGNHDIRRVDLLEDTGRSLSPKIDVAQIEGAFVMGLGYWTSEKMVYDPDSGKLLTDRTWTYKPPGLKDIPADFRIYFRRNSRNPFGVLQSKASGEPALCLASVLTHAIREAVMAARLDAGYEDKWLDIPKPCTVENIFMAADHKLEHFILK